jgi:hypothetical protein
MTLGRLSTIALLLSAVALAASACGRRADLDTPYRAAVDARKQAKEDKVTPLPPEPAKPVKDHPFFLDRLIE